ncbi:MAG: hypothetical protein KJ900_04470 [Proteobacteria bacterium]|nr:hypothetical protein [Pseudomonadota bacterium]MCG2744408.1 hypothetical protein [Desulfobacteraceae bacterium]MBU3984192.1 hypothetical protein [Pseudomonadota bacterium]MBU4028978.1 hypothetical protein [Pseudomonadota bacterium]MBU4042139.1 hypothetical protein [Pseudomonadota bacterium]
MAQIIGKIILGASLPLEGHNGSGCCFGYTEEDLCQDVLRHGRSLIMERILAESKDGHCRCAETNPSSR